MPDTMMPGTVPVSLETSPTTAALDEALAKAQGEIQTASKDKNNPAFRSKYADLGAVWDACRSALTTNGLSVVQMPTDAGEGRVGLDGPRGRARTQRARLLCGAGRGGSLLLDLSRA